MSAKIDTTKIETQKSKTGPPPAYAASTISMALQNQINMVVVFAVSGAILFGLFGRQAFLGPPAFAPLR